MLEPPSSSKLEIRPGPLEGELVFKIPENKAKIEDAIREALRDISKTNVYHLKAGLRILMTTTPETFASVCSAKVQRDLKEFIEFLSNPERLTPATANDDKQKEIVINYIKKYTLENLHLLDDRTSILPNTTMVQKSIKEGEQLKQVVHASALRNLAINTHYFSDLKKKFINEGMEELIAEKNVKKAMKHTTLLYKAVVERNISDILGHLAVRGVDINLPNERGMTPLHVAAQAGLIEITKLLLTVPHIKPNLVSNNGWTPLHIAARSGYADIVQALIATPSVEVNVVNSDGWTALHWAAWHGYSEVVTILVTTPHVDVNFGDKNGTTPLHLAARNGHADILAIFLSVPQVKVNPEDNEGKSPLDLAANYNHEAAVKTLLGSRDVDVNHADSEGFTALHWSARNGDLAILKLLLSHTKIDVNKLDSNGMNALEWAVQNEQEEAVTILKEYIHPKVPQQKRGWLSKMKSKFFRSKAASK